MKYSWESEAGTATDGQEIQGSLPSGWDTWAALAAVEVSQYRAASAKRMMCCDHTTKTILQPEKTSFSLENQEAGG